MKYYNTLLLIGLIAIMACEDNKSSRKDQANVNDSTTATAASEQSADASNIVPASPEAPADPGAPADPNAVAASGTQDEAVDASVDAQHVDIAQLYDALCQEIAGIKFKEDLKEELSVFCKKEKATEKFAELAEAAYDGVGDLEPPEPVKLKSDFSETEVIMAAALKLEKPLQAIRDMKEVPYSLNVRDDDGFFIETELAKTVAAENETYGESYIFEQSIGATLLVALRFEDQAIVHTYPILFKNDKIGFAYSILEPGKKENRNNRIYKVVNFMVQASESMTYNFTMVHITGANLGVPNIAERILLNKVGSTIQAYHEMVMK